MDINVYSTQYPYDIRSYPYSVLGIGCGPYRPALYGPFFATRERFQDSVLVTEHPLKTYDFHTEKNVLVELNRMPFREYILNRIKESKGRNDKKCGKWKKTGILVGRTGDFFQSAPKLNFKRRQFTLVTSPLKTARIATHR